MTHLLSALRTHPATLGLISSLGSLWISFVEVLPAIFRVMNLVVAFMIGIITLALKIREWRRKRRARTTQPPDATQSEL